MNLRVILFTYMSICLPKNISLELSLDNELFYKSITIDNVSYIPILKTEFGELKNIILRNIKHKREIF